MRAPWIRNTVERVRDLGAVADAEYDALTLARDMLIDNCYEIAGFRCEAERGTHDRCKLCPLRVINSALGQYETGELNA